MRAGEGARPGRHAWLREAQRKQRERLWSDVAALLRRVSKPE
jgi:hypothetical protein